VEVMKYQKLIIFLFGLIILQHAKGQDSSAVQIEKPKKVSHIIYHCWLFGDTAFNSHVRKCFIQSVVDSGIVFSVSVKGNSFYSPSRELKFLNVSSMEKIKIRRKGGVGTGIAIGAGAGFFVGAILGASGVTDYGILTSLSPGQNALIGGILFTVPAAIIGGIAGSVRIKIPINKSQKLYKLQREKIAHYITANWH
jgi:hypothetical protein